MGDDLPEKLYKAFVDNSNGVAGGDVPNWASLPSSERERWDAIAAKARGHMLDQFFGCLDSIEQSPEFENESPAHELRRRFGR